MFTNKANIFPAVFLGKTIEGKYRFNCYFGFDNIQEITFEEKFIEDKDNLKQYCYIGSRTNNGQTKYIISPINESEVGLFEEKFLKV